MSKDSLANERAVVPSHETRRNWGEEGCALDSNKTDVPWIVVFIIEV